MWLIGGKVNVGYYSKKLLMKLEEKIFFTLDVLSTSYVP